MKTWQDIFAAKIADKHLKEPWKLREDNTLEFHVLKPGWKEFVQYRALGRFQCSQCFHEWSSAKVHVLFHMRQGRHSGKVRLRVFRQACRRCPNPRLEQPDFSQETVERLLHNLVLKILQDFYCVPTQLSDFQEVVVDAMVAGPHDSTRCEGCQVGCCSKSRPAPASNTGKTRTHRTPKHRHTRHYEALTHHSSSFTSNFPWKRCCCFFGISLLCILAVLLFFVFYFTKD